MNIAKIADIIIVVHRIVGARSFVFSGIPLLSL